MLITFYLNNVHGYDIGVPEGSGSVDALASVDCNVLNIQINEKGI